VVNVLICHIHPAEELMKTQTEKILAEQRQTCTTRNAKAKRKTHSKLERPKYQADNSREF